MSIPSMAHSLSWLLALIAVSTELARAQCPEFSPDFGPPGGGIAGGAKAQVVFDDGTGPALYVAGVFATAGDVAANNVARWDGTRWSALGSGIPQQGIWVYTLAVFDLGNGPALIAGGDFSNAGGVPVANIAAWNGATWSPIGHGIDGVAVEALAVFDDGTGPALYAGGNLTGSNGTPLHTIAKWNGSSWSDVSGGSPIGEVFSLWVHDDGTGAKLYAGGNSGVSRWDGSSWSTFGGPANGYVRCMTTYDDGSGSALYVGGLFSSVGGLPAGSVARWDGQTWSTLSGGLALTNGVPDVQSLGVYDSGSGSRLYVGGLFSSAGGAPAFELASWDGSTWTPIDGVYSSGVTSFGVFDAGSGPVLHVGASVESATSSVVMGIARWDGAHWSRMQSGSFQGVDGMVRSLATYDDGGGRAVYAGGILYAAGDVFTGYPWGGYEVFAGGIAKWDGVNWSALGSGIHGAVFALAEYDDGTGSALYAAGVIASAGGSSSGNVVRWNGQSWSLVGPVGSLHPEVDSLCVYDDGSGAKLYAGGLFSGGFVVWDPVNNNWVVPPGGTVGGGVECMMVHDGGAGSTLVVAGYFGSPGQDIVEWNGSSFAPFGCGLGYPNLNDHVRALASFDFGAGPQLVAGGNFHWADCVPSSNVVRWNGTTWSSLPNLVGNIRSLVRFDDGSGPGLYAGGVIPGGVARYAGSSWSPVGGSSGGYGFPLMADEIAANGRNDLVIGRDITTASVQSVGFAIWQGCPSPGTKFCFGDGSGGSCPCANDGAPGRGCENSHRTGGAELTVDGGIHPDSVVLRTTGELTHALSVFLQGTADVGPFLYGDGLRCAGGTLRRLFIKSAVGGFASAPQAGDLSITARSAQLGDPIAPGSTRYYQTYYRDPNSTFCPNPPGNTWNTTNGVRITW